MIKKNKLEKNIIFAFSISDEELALIPDGKTFLVFDNGLKKFICGEKEIFLDRNTNNLDNLFFITSQNIKNFIENTHKINRFKDCDLELKYFFENDEQNLFFMFKMEEKMNVYIGVKNKDLIVPIGEDENLCWNKIQEIKNKKQFKM